MEWKSLAAALMTKSATLWITMTSKVIGVYCVKRKLETTFCDLSSKSNKCSIKGKATEAIYIYIYSFGSFWLMWCNKSTLWLGGFHCCMLDSDWEVGFLWVPWFPPKIHKHACLSWLETASAASALHYGHIWTDFIHCNLGMNQKD